MAHFYIGVLAAKLFITLDVIEEINTGEPEKVISRKKFFIKLMIGLVLYVQIAKSMFSKCQTFLSVIEGKTTCGKKTLFLGLLWA